MATKYIDNRLTTGANDGSSAANAWRSIYDSTQGTVNPGDVVEFIAGSGPYREAFHATRLVKLTTQVVFSAAGKTITCTGSGMGTTIFQASGNYIRVTGSSLNDGQYIITGNTADSLTVDSTCNLQDETITGTIFICNVTCSLGSYAFDQKRSGSSGSPIVWNMNGVEINSGVDLMTSKYKWNKSTGAAGEYYLTRSDGSNPCLQRPDSMVVNGWYYNASSSEAIHNFGTPGSLSLETKPGWGNADALSFSTIYIKSSGGNPSTLGWTIEKAELFGCIYQGWNYHTWKNGIFKFSNDGSGTFTTGVVTMRGSATGYKFQRCTFAWGGGHGAELLATSGTQVMTLDHCVFYWTGHRSWHHSGSSVASNTLNVYNCLDIGSHIFGLISSTATSFYTTNVYGNISLNGESGAIDKKSRPANLYEDYNHWYPSFNATGTGNCLGYISTNYTPITLSATSGAGVTVTSTGNVFNASDVGQTLLAGTGVASITAYTDAKHITVTVTTTFDTTSYAANLWKITGMWLSTGKNDIPSNTATTISSRSSLTDPKITNINNYSYTLCNFKLKEGSPCIGRGPWNIGDSFTDFAGNQYTSGAGSYAKSLNMGIYQNLANSRPYQL